MARKPIRTSLQFDLDVNAMLIVQTETIDGRRHAVLNICPGGARRGQNVTVYLEPEKALELASQLQEVARGA